MTRSYTRDFREDRCWAKNQHWHEERACYVCRPIASRKMVKRYNGRWILTLKRKGRYGRSTKRQRKNLYRAHRLHNKWSLRFRNEVEKYDREWLD